MSRNRSASQSAIRKITLIVLAVLMIGTVFLLPQFVSEPWMAGDSADLPVVPESSPSTVAPSTAAELKRYRQESQGVLAEVVAMRDRLLERNVDRWAEADFKQALDKVASGDERYGYGDYEESLELFRQASAELVSLEELGRQKLAEAKSATEAAIESLNVNVATVSIELAEAIAAQDPAVQELAARVETLGQVAAHLEAGDQALARDRFQTAQAEYRQAVALDPAHQRAARSLALAGNEVSSSTFRGHMSRGFAALERQDYAGARSAFRDAGRLSPGDAAVEQALAQVDNQESAAYVRVELARAAELETREQWRDAQSIYEALLEQDSSLTDARVRLIPSRVRADLDERMAAYIEEPLRLSSAAEHQAAKTALADARSIPNPGPRLSGQIAELNALVAAADTPVEVVFRSDNQTHVILYRVADLGQFEQVSLSLRPGNYVAAGSRSGYRDVRVEFTVTGESKEKTILVRCEEPIG
jgi:tetratricopeptide (TPR) repeat protein